jgi:hypothetical protein
VHARALTVCVLITVRLPCDRVYYRVCTCDMSSYPSYFDKYVVINAPLFEDYFIDLLFFLLRLRPWSGFWLGLGRVRHSLEVDVLGARLRQIEVNG